MLWALFRVRVRFVVRAEIRVCIMLSLRVSEGFGASLELRKFSSLILT